MFSISPKDLHHRKRFVLLSLVVMLLVLARCSGPAEVQQPAVPVEVVPEPEGPAYAVFYFDEAGLQAHQARPDTRQMLLPNSTFQRTMQIRYNTSRVRKLLATGDELRSVADVERSLLPLLPLSGDAGLSEQQEEVMDLLPDILAKQEIAPNAVRVLLRAFIDQRPLMESLHEFWSKR